MCISKKKKKKMTLNLHPNKQAQEITTQSTTHQHLMMILHTKLDFRDHLEDIFSMINTTIGLLTR